MCSMQYESLALSSFNAAQPFFMHDRGLLTILQPSEIITCIECESSASCSVAARCSLAVSTFEQSPTSSVFVLSFIRSVRHFAPHIVGFSLNFIWLSISVGCLLIYNYGEVFLVGRMNTNDRPRTIWPRCLLYKTAIKCLNYKSD